MLLDRIPDSAAAVHAYLNRMPMFKKDGPKAANFKLDETSALLNALGNPHTGQRFFHVGGTNGKGSTSALLASVLQEAGLRTGLYTSPHVTVYNERIKINGSMIPDDALLAFFQRFGDVLMRFEHTYFELSTVLAFWWFREQQVDAAVIEVGLGGRLDATNVISPLVSVITSIGLDHMEQLGPTEDLIAAEKAGIIKPGVPVVVGNVQGDAQTVLQFHAYTSRSALHLAEALDPRVKHGRIAINNGEPPYDCPLRGEAQAWNVASAWLAIRAVQQELPVDDAAFRRGVARVLENTGLPGRFEQLHPGRRWYFDGGHNGQALENAAKTVAELSPEGDPVLIFSMMRDKVTPEALAPFFGFKEIWYYGLDSERAASFAEFAAVAGHARHLDGPETLKAIVRQHPSRCVVFLGSFYFYNTVRQWLTTC